MTRTNIIATALWSALLIGGFALAQPKQNVSGARHPNIAEAQRLSERAYQKITAAQQANEWDMQGHAAKAKQLLEEVNNELRQAATSANNNKK